MKIFWKCGCGNINKVELKDYLVFTFEQKNQRAGNDYCAKCKSEHDFELDLKMFDKGPGDVE